MDLRLINLPDRGRFELHDEGGLVGVVNYEDEGDRAVIFHTEIVAGRRGQGLGAELVRRVLDEMRSEGRQIVPLCTFVRSYIGRHPGYSDLVA